MKRSRIYDMICHKIISTHHDLSQQNKMNPLSAASAARSEELDYRPLGGPSLKYLWYNGGSSSSSSCGGIDDYERCSSSTSSSSNPQNSSTGSLTNDLAGQTLYLGGNVGIDGNIYYIPGHARRILRVNPQTDVLEMIGDVDLIGKFKWLRGVRAKQGEVIYGLPCHSDCVLKIHVPTQTVSLLSIPYHEFYSQADEEEQQNSSSITTSLAQQQKNMLWKYHGGVMSPLDECIYCIPQSALHVLKIDPNSDTCELVGPPLPGKYKWYGGVIGKSDLAIYGIPQCAESIIRILPKEYGGITLFGELGSGGHKWHGAAASPVTGVIVGVPANADTVLCIHPASSPHDSPSYVLLGDSNVVASGRHRHDNRYKYLGAMAPTTNSCVYCFPSGSEYVLEVDTQSMSVRNIGPNLRTSNLERCYQNKWQNGVYLKEQNVIFGIPLAGESVLMIDFGGGNEPTNCAPIVSTWKIPRPYSTLAKWEGATVAVNGVVYTVPNCHKAVLRIELPYGPRNNVTISKEAMENEPINIKANDETSETSDKHSTPKEPELNGHIAVERNEEECRTTSHVETSNQSTLNGPSNNKTSDEGPSCNNSISQSDGSCSTMERLRDVRELREQPPNLSDLKYRSGIPTLRSSAHRVKHKERKYDPSRSRNLPQSVRLEQVFSYNSDTHDLKGALIELLRNCDPNIVGNFPQDIKTDQRRLESFVVPVASTWRSANGGQCENAQKYVSEQVESNQSFMKVFDRFVVEAVLPYLKSTLLASSEYQSDVQNRNMSSSNGDLITFYYQRPPTVRLQPGPAWASVKAHNDAVYGHQHGEINYWIPLTDRTVTKVDLWCESEPEKGDYHPILAYPGEIVSFHGSLCRHYVNTNSTSFTRVSLDFRVGVEHYFDPDWKMCGTTDDHGRRQVTL